MPLANVTTHREEILEVMADRSHMQTLTGNFLESAYFTADSAQHKFVRPGLIVAKNTATKKYTPWNASPSYGPGSNLAVGVLDVPLMDVSLEDAAISPVFHGKLIEAHCYVYGGVLGVIPTAVKDALEQIEWV